MSRLQVAQQIFSLTHNCMHVYQIFSIYQTVPIRYVIRVSCFNIYKVHFASSLISHYEALRHNYVFTA